MPETQVDQTVPVGSGDADFDAALAQASAEPGAPAETVAAEPAPTEPEAPSEPVADPDFTFATLENGQREMRLATGQVYRGKDDQELYAQLAKAQVAASKRITELSRAPEPIAPTPVAPTPPSAIDPTALALADLMAPAFGAKTGQELISAFAEQQRIAQAQQEFMAAQQANFEAQKFFAAVPDFVKSPTREADSDKIDRFLQANGIPFSGQTAEMVYNHLKAKGEINAAPATTRASAPRNQMPAPPQGTSPANTGKGAPTEADLWNMTADQLAELLTASAPQ